MRIIVIEGAALKNRIEFAYFFAEYAQDGGVYPVYHHALDFPLDKAVREIERAEKANDGKGYFLSWASSENHAEAIKTKYGSRCTSVFLLNKSGDPGNDAQYDTAGQFIAIMRWDVIVPATDNIKHHARTMAEWMALP